MIHRREWAPRTLGTAALVVLVMACSHARAPASSIDGTYRAYSGPNVLEFKGAAWTLTTGARVFSAKFVVAGEQLISSSPTQTIRLTTSSVVRTWTSTRGPATETS